MGLLDFKINYKIFFAVHLKHSSIWPSANVKPGNTNCRGRLSTVDLLIKVACFVKK